MLDLSNNNPPLDLKYRIDQYKINNSPYIFDERYPLVVTGMLRRNRPLEDYIGTEDPFETKLLQLMIKISNETSSLLEGFYAGYTAGDRFILIYHPSLIRLPIYRDNLISLISSRVVNLASSEYSNPMCLVTTFQLPNKNEIQNILSYYKMNWLAKRNRLLGEIVCGIPRTENNFSHTKVLELVEKKGFNLSTLTASQRSGFFFSPYVSSQSEV